VGWGGKEWKEQKLKHRDHKENETKEHDKLFKTSIKRKILKNNHSKTRYIMYQETTKTDSNSSSETMQVR
jgi:hypothetical protein